MTGAIAVAQKGKKARGPTSAKIIPSWHVHIRRWYSMKELVGGKAEGQQLLLYACIDTG